MDSLSIKLEETFSKKKLTLSEQMFTKASENAWRITEINHSAAYFYWRWGTKALKKQNKKKEKHFSD